MGAMRGGDNDGQRRARKPMLAHHGASRATKDENGKKNDDCGDERRASVGCEWPRGEST